VLVSDGTLDVAATVSQVAGSSLTAGTWTVAGSSTVHSTLDITSAGTFTTIGSKARVTLSGVNTSFTNLSGLTTIAKGGQFSLLKGQFFTTSGALTNRGMLTLGPASVLTVSGSFTQSSVGTLHIELGGTSTVPTFGQLLCTSGTVTLAGSLKVTSTVVPGVNNPLTILDNDANGGNSAIVGNFAGLTEGSTFTVTAGTTTMTFQITYVWRDGDGNDNVVINRLS
jgi:hypothetical protein